MLAAACLLLLTAADATPRCATCRFGCFWGAGQVCSATSRLLVHESIAPAFYARLKQRAESIKASGWLQMRKWVDE